MGVIFAKLWARFVSREYKLLVVGLDNAGKTTTLYRLHLGETVHSPPTVGSNVEEVVTKNGKGTFFFFLLSFFLFFYFFFFSSIPSIREV